MPDTPEYQATVAPEVTPGASLPMAATPDAYGAGIGDAVQGLGEVAHELHVRARNYADRSAILDADNQTNGFLNDRLYNAQTGLLHQNPGKNAPQAVDQTLADYDKHVSEVSASLSDDRQRVAYQRMAQNRRLDLDRQLGDFEHKETSRYADEVDGAAITQASNMAVQNAGDPAIVGKSIGHLQEVIQSAGERKGMAPEKIKEQQDLAVSQVNLGVITQMVSSGHSSQAKEWYDGHSKEFVGDDLTKATHMVQAGTDAQEAQDVADQLGRGDDGRPVDRVTALDRIEKDPRLVKDARLRQSVLQLVNQNIDQHQKAEGEHDSATVEEAVGLLNDPGNTQGPANAQYVALKASLPVKWRDHLTSIEHKEIPEYSQRVADIQRMVGTEAFLHWNPMSDKGRIQDSQLYHFAELQREQVEKGASGPKIAVAMSQEKIVGTAIKTLNLVDYEGQEKSEALDFRNQFDVAHRAAVVANGGKEVDEEELAGIAKKLSADYAVDAKRSWYNPARWVGSDMTTESKGPLYQQPRDTILRNIPIPGTVVRSGDGLSARDVEGYINVLTNPEAPTFPQFREQMSQWRRGIADDGTPDPALRARYDVINAHLAAALSGDLALRARYESGVKRPAAGGP